MSNEVGQIKAFVPYAGPSTAKRYAISDEEWDNLRPLIKCLYIDENKTFNAIASILEGHRGIKPSKKQFIRVITRWGLQKNIKRSERRAIVAAFDQGNDAFGHVTKGRNFDEAKIERWRKRDGLVSVTSGSTIEVEVEEEENSNEVEEEIEVDDDIPMAQDSTDVGPPQTGDESNIPAMNMWESVDIMGSPRLTGLIGLLSLLDLDEMTPLELSQGEGIAAADRELETALGLQPSNDKDGDIFMTEEPSSTSVVASRSTNFTSRLLSKLAATSFSLTSTRQHESLVPQLSYELDPFPANILGRKYPGEPCWRGALRVPSRPQVLTKNQCLTRLRRMRKTKLPDAELLQEMWTIAQEYKNQGNWSAAESWYRRIVTAKHRVPGFRPYETLKSCLAVVDALWNQSRNTEAYNLLAELHFKIMQIIKSHDELALRSLHLLSRLAADLDHHEEAESFARQLLQITLMKFGLKSGETLESMSNLGARLKVRDHNSESEFLLRRVLHEQRDDMLHKKLDKHSASNIIRTTRRLAESLRSSGRPDEAEELLRGLRETYEAGIRDANPGVECTYELVHAMYTQKAYGYTELAVREFLDSKKITMSVYWRSLFERLLARTLLKTGRFSEAVDHYHEPFAIFDSLNGLQHHSTLKCAKDMGYCYEGQGLYNKALTHYQSILDRLALLARKNSVSVDDSVQRVNRWMSRVLQEKREYASDSRSAQELLT